MRGLFASAAVWLVLSAGPSFGQSPPGDVRKTGDLRDYVNSMKPRSTNYLMPDGSIVTQQEFARLQEKQNDDLKKQLAKSGSSQTNRATGNIIDTRKGVNMKAYAAPTQKSSWWARVVAQIDPFSSSTPTTVRLHPIGSRPPVDGTPATFTMPK